MMTEEEQRDFETFTLASLNARRGKTSWKASQENTNILRPSRPAVAVSRWQPGAFTRLSRSGPRSSLAFVSTGSGSSPGSACRSGSVPCPASSRSRSATPGFGLSCDLESLFEDENFSLDLDKEAALREKHACSEALDRVAEFCKLDRQGSDAKREVMGMRLQPYIAPARKSIELSLPWHSSTIPIADRNHNIVLVTLGYPYIAPARKSIELSLPWHSSTIPIADRNHNIVLATLGYTQ